MIMKRFWASYKSSAIKFKNLFLMYAFILWNMIKDLSSIAVIPIVFFYKTIISSFIHDIQSVSVAYAPEKNLLTMDLNMKESSYRTEFSNHKLWLDKIYDLLGFSDIVCSILLGATPLLIGFIYSLFIGFHELYITTLPIWLGVLGITLTCYSIRYGSKSFHSKYSYLRPCFIVSDIRYKEFVSTWFDRLSNNYPTFVFSIIAFLLFISLAYIRYYHSGILVDLNLTSIEPKGFLIKNWYEEPYINLKYILMSLFAAFVAFPLITALRLLYINFFFLMDFKNLRVIPFSNILKIRLRKITNMYIIISLLWMIGVSLFGVLFFTKFDLVSLSLISTLSVLGILTFSAPQLIYRNLLIKSEEVNSSLVINSFYEKLGGKLDDINNGVYKNTINKFKIDEYVDIIGSTQIADKWIYNPGQVAAFVMGQAAALLSPEFLSTIKTISE